MQPEGKKQEVNGALLAFSGSHQNLTGQGVQKGEMETCVVDPYR